MAIEDKWDKIRTAIEESSKMVIPKIIQCGHKKIGLINNAKSLQTKRHGKLYSQITQKRTGRDTET